MGLFWAGLGIRLMGGTVLCVFQLNQTVPDAREDKLPGADSYAYHRTTVYVAELLWNNPARGWEVFTRPNAWSQDPARKAEFRKTLVTNVYAYNLVRFMMPLALLSGFTYFGLGLLCSAVGFAGSWVLFMTLGRLHPPGRSGFAAVLLFFPSYIVFASGILKEPFVLAGLQALVAVVVYVAMGLRPSRWLLFWAGVGCALAWWVKPYPLVALLPVLMLLLLIHPPATWLNHRVRVVIRWGGGVAVLALTAWVVLASPIRLRVALADALWMRDHTLQKYLRRQPDRNYVRLPVNQDNWSYPGLALAAPAALGAVTLRPLPSESTKPQEHVAAAENVLLALALGGLVLVSLYRLWRYRVWGLAGNVWLMLLVFAVPYGYFIGLTEPLFGNLIRYRVYTLPFMLIAFIGWATSAKSSSTATMAYVMRNVRS